MGTADRAGLTCIHTRLHSIGIYIIAGVELTSALLAQTMAR